MLHYFNLLVKLIRKELKVFLVYGITFAVLSLVIPFGVQILVNRLALANIRTSLVSLLILLFLVLCLAQFIRFIQFILLEYLQRSLLHHFLKEFMSKRSELNPSKKIYFFEIFNLKKTITSWIFDGFEFCLAFLVGLVVLTLYHPYFLLLSIFLMAGYWYILKLGHHGFESSIIESNQKYKLYHDYVDSHKNEADIEQQFYQYIQSRHLHYRVVRKQTLANMVLLVFGNLFLLGGGSFLVMNDQLSLGQLVSAEIIFSGVFYYVNKFQKMLENHYDLFTSYKKIIGAVS